MTDWRLIGVLCSRAAELRRVPRRREADDLRRPRLHQQRVAASSGGQQRQRRRPGPWPGDHNVVDDERSARVRRQPTAVSD